MVRKQVNCPVCVSALPAEAGETLHPFMGQKDRGGLVKASESVVQVCHETEKCFEFMMKATSGKLPHCKDLEHIVSSAVLANMSADDNHVYPLVKVIAACFSRIRLHHLGSRVNEEAMGDRVRKQLSKLILFKHQ